MRSPKNNWDFWTSLPEALHQVTIVMSDRGIPATYRHMHGFGSHTFSFINAKNERYWVKFHFKSQQGIMNLTDAEAEAIVGKDRESHQRDLYESIEKCDFPKWTLKVQVMPEKDRSVGGAPREIQIHHIGNCLKADLAYGEGVAKALGIFSE